jgi:4-amino-4-deoxy-L-arabinose transferase-like glycosyltransferase
VDVTDIQPARSGGALDPHRLGLWLVAAVTVMRVAVLFASPLQLYPDEAQYWVWSRTPAFGYFSKPPMIAWLIGLTTSIGGDGEAWVRISAPLMHGAAALVLAAVGRRLYGPWAGFWALVVYTLMPGVQLSTVVIATDAPLLLFLSLALFAYAGFIDADDRRRPVWAAGVGLALGLACLAKYAALYYLLGLVLHAVVDREARARWRPAHVALALAGLGICIAPNAIWNVENGFHTVSHTVANLGRISLGGGVKRPDLAFDPREAPGFFLSQFGVFGPVPFAVLIGGAVLLARRRALASADRMLLCFALPPILLVLGEALVARANANWAGAAYSAGSVLVAGWLVRWGARKALAALVVSQAALAAATMVVVAAPGLVDGTGLANSLKRARGWREATATVLERLAATRASGPVSALAVDDRFLFNAISYYGRDTLAAPGAPPLRIWVREGRPNNQAEAMAPLTPAEGARVVFAQAIAAYRPETVADFAAVTDEAPARIPLDRKRVRELVLFTGLGFQPRAVRHGDRRR